MRRPDPNAGPLDPAQIQIAETGLKAMIPIGRPFLDYVLNGLADAGCQEVCLVVGPEHNVIRDYYIRQCVPKRLALTFAVQERPLGTADALAAAEGFTAGQTFLVLNSDNYYPVNACRALRLLGEPGLAAFEHESLILRGNMSAERIRQFAAIVIASDGTLERIIEKPDEKTLGSLVPEIYVSMNCWSFDSAIFGACAAINPSPRGELELPDAVQYAIDKLGVRFRVLPFHAGVLDLSSRSDIQGVVAGLRGIEVHL
jgi:glucose-1-phosphate thymidylyltransferase